MKTFSVIVLLLVQSIFAQADFTEALDYGKFSGKFSVDAANYLGSEPGLSATTIFIQVPYSGIQFVKQGFRFNAEYTITLKITETLFDSVVYHNIWTEGVKTREFEKTKSENSFNLSQKVVELEPGDYKIFCMVEDNNSQRKKTINKTLIARSINDTLDISDIMLISKVVRSKRGDEIIPNVENSVTSKLNELAFYFEIYSNKETDIPLEFVLYDKMRDKSTRFPGTKHVLSGRNMIYHKLDNTKFTLGNYDLHINSLVDSSAKMLGSIKSFRSSYKSIPSSINDLDKAVDQMIYIATSTAIDSIKSIPDYNERLKKYVAYWDRIDPTPDTDANEVMNEYYARVSYTNLNFKSYFEGWKSDMGWIFITLGPPDYVYRQPMASDEKPYELWTYYEINRTFKFTDETGFGHYRLVNPEYGDWLRYRY